MPPIPSSPESSPSPPISVTQTLPSLRTPTQCDLHEARIEAVEERIQRIETALGDQGNALSNPPQSPSGIVGHVLSLRTELNQLTRPGKSVQKITQWAAKVIVGTFLVLAATWFWNNPPHFGPPSQQATHRSESP